MTRLHLANIEVIETDRRWLDRFVRVTWHPGLDRNARETFDADRIREAGIAFAGEQVGQHRLVKYEVFGPFSLSKPAALEPVAELITAVSHGAKYRQRAKSFQGQIAIISDNLPSPFMLLIYRPCARTNC